MSSPSPRPPALQQLRRLDQSSSDFHDQLCNVLYGKDYAQCVPNLQGDDVVWLVDYLDKALDGLDPCSTAARRCLRELRSICGASAILPISYTLSSDLLNIGPDPFVSGGYGDVYTGTLDGSRVCVKRVRTYTNDGPQKAAKIFCQEAVLWKRLTHPHVLPLLGVTIAPFQLVSNWMSGGDLPTYIKKNTDANRLGLLSDVANGLYYLHSCHVIHGDLKGPNVLVDDSGRACIADFGLAAVTRNLDSKASTSCRNGHTPRWTAPEVLEGGKYSKEADVFSFAMVMIEVFTGAIPFSGGSTFAAILATARGERPPRPTHPTFTENLWMLMQRCWDNDPASRPKVSEALQVLQTPEHPAWKQLINPTLAMHERIPLITTIFSDNKQVEVVMQLSGDDAQAFINMIEEASDSLLPEVRRSCLHYLHRICVDQALLPRSLEIPLCYDPKENPMYHNGLVDIWKGQNNGRQVTAEVLKPGLGDDPKQVRRRFCKEVVVWRALRHPNVLPLLGVTMTETWFVMVSELMPNGNINEFVEANVNADRLELLGGVTKGLIYMHEQGIIHGDLKGANIMIDNNDRACITGFSLLTIASDQSTTKSSRGMSGTVRWMSPELFYPGMFNLRNGRPTKESDCYALGMVIYEVLSGRPPFASYSLLAIMSKVLDDERPERPRGSAGKLFTDGIWAILELCWKHQPGDRISAKDVLLRLEQIPSPLRPPSDVDGDSEVYSGGQSDDTSGGSSARITCGDCELPEPPQGSPSELNPAFPQGGGQFLDPPPIGNPQEERIVYRFARNVRRVFTRKPYGS